MSDCQKYLDMINPFIDNELSKEEREEFLKHISNCENCREEFNQIKDMVENIKNIPLEVVPKELHNEIMNRVRGEKRISFPWQKYSLIAAAFICVFVIFNQVDFNKEQEPITRSMPDMASMDIVIPDSLTIKTTDFQKQADFYENYGNENNLDVIVGEGLIMITGKYSDLFNLIREIQVREEVLNDNFGYYEDENVVCLTLVLE